MRKLLSLAAFVALAASAPAPAATWEIDPGHSSATFRVRHLAVTNVSGSMGRVTGKIVWDEADPTTASVEATIDATGISTGVEDRDKHLKGPDFFDVAKHPTIAFKSRLVEKAAGGLKVTGDLTMHGVTKEVVLMVEGPLPAIKDPWGNTKSGASATTKLNRQDFGVSWSKTLDGGGLVVGNEVSVTIDIEMKRL
jgi:polyisoprenoid-binding protein YceI